MIKGKEWNALSLGKIIAYVRALVMWRYSVLHPARTEVESSTKDNIMQLVGLDSLAGTEEYLCSCR
jgi:hypothetical protein